MSEVAAAPLAVAQPTRELSAEHQQERGPSRWVWIGLAIALLAAFAAFDLWLLRARGAISSELLYWEAQRHLIEGADPPRLNLLVTSSQPLLLYLAAIGGSAIAAAAVAGMASILELGHGWWRACRDAGRGLAWLVPMVLTVAHPAVLLTAAQYPQPALRALLILSCITWLLRYAEGGATYTLLVAAASLAGVGLLEPAPWVLWLYLALALLFSSARGRDEQLARVLMLLFPAVFLAVGRALLGLQLGGGLGPGQAHWAGCQATGADALSAAVDPNCVLSAGPISTLPAELTSLAVLVPAAVLMGVWALGRVLANYGSGRLGVALLLLLPLVEPLARPWLAPEAMAARPLDVMLPLLAMPLLASYAWAHRFSWLGWGLSSLALAFGLVFGWAGLLLQPSGSPLHPGTEPAALMRSVTGQPAAWLQPHRAVAAELDRRLQAGQRVLLDDTELYPVVALVAAPGALLLPNDPAYGIASQCPDGLADFVVLKVPDEPDGAAALAANWGARLSDYDTVVDSGAVQLYALARPGATPRCLGLTH